MIHILTIKFNSPLHHGSGFGLSGLVDRAVLRNTSGTPYLAAIKGKLRHATLRVLLSEDQPACHTGDSPRLCNVPNLCAICALFGSPRHEGGLFFSDGYARGDAGEMLTELAKLELPGGLRRDSTVRARTAIDRKLGTVQPRMLFSTEVLPEFLEFESRVYGDLGLHLPLLQKACRVITRFGADGARGLGECTLSINLEATR